MNITTRYDLGQTVWSLRLWNEKRWVTCDLCDGKGKVPIGTTDRTTYCPDCQGRGGQHTPEDVLSAAIRKLTVGQITVRLSESESERSYMCVETGVGSGQNHREDNLHPTQAAAKRKAVDAGARILEGATP